MAGIKRNIIICILCLMPTLLLAESTMARRRQPNEIRIGYGDPFFETTAWFESPYRDYGKETHNYRYTGHIFAEYQRRHNHWFGYGLQLDFEEVLWDEWTHTATGIEKLNDRNFYNVSLIPTTRFTYLHNYWVNLYSGLGLGLLINGGTEVDLHGHHVTCAPVFQLTALGLSVGNERWFGTFELGGLTSLTSTDNIFMVFSRIISASVGVRF